MDRPRPQLAPSVFGDSLLPEADDLTNNKEDALNALDKVNQARKALIEAKTLDEVLHVRDVDELAKHWAKMANAGLEAMNEAAEVKLRAERKAGKFLEEAITRGGDRRSNSQADSLKVSDFGLTHSTSSRWQRMASVPEDKFEEYLEVTRSAGKELTSSGLYKIAQRMATKPTAEREEHDPTTRIVDSFDNLSGVQFGTVYADPPWKYGNQATRASTDNHYDTMTVDQLCEMPVADVVADDAHLHLWTTNAFLFDAKRVMDAWGFEYRSCFVWVKPQMGIGNYWRVSHEFLLLGVRGDAKRFFRRDRISWGEFDRSAHSRKPEQIRKFIEECSPGPYLELFGRRRVIGWTVFGNQTQKELELEV